MGSACSGRVVCTTAADRLTSDQKQKEETDVVSESVPFGGVLPHQHAPTQSPQATAYRGVFITGEVAEDVTEETKTPKAAHTHSSSNRGGLNTSAVNGCGCATPHAAVPMTLDPNKQHTSRQDAGVSLRNDVPSSFTTTVERHSSWENASALSPPTAEAARHPGAQQDVASRLQTSSRSESSIVDSEAVTGRVRSTAPSPTSAPTPLFFMSRPNSTVVSPKEVAVESASPNAKRLLSQPVPDEPQDEEAVFCYVVPSSPIALRNWLDGTDPAVSSTTTPAQALDDNTSPLGSRYKIGRRKSSRNAKGNATKTANEEEAQGGSERSVIKEPYAAAGPL
jgi:hypothetical protein